MAKFIVEIVSAGNVEKVETIDASTPIRAASIMIGGPVTVPAQARPVDQGDAGWRTGVVPVC